MNDATRNDLTGAELVEQHWTYDGPHSSDTVTDAAPSIRMVTRYDRRR